MCGGDVGEIERRILPQQHDVHRREIDHLVPAEGEMIADDIAHLDLRHTRDGATAAQAEVLRLVVEQPLPGVLITTRGGAGRPASSISAKVVSPATLIRSIGSIWTATLGGMVRPLPG